MITKKDFNILNDWTIKISQSKKIFDCCCIDLKGKKATIFQPSVSEKDYWLHEYLHIALSSLRSIDKRKVKEVAYAEEQLIRDICWLTIQE